MPKYSEGSIEVGDSRILLDDATLPPEFTENFVTSVHSGRWVGSGVTIRRVWKDISVSGDNWGAGFRQKIIFTMAGTGPWNRYGIFITSALIWTNVGGTGTFNIGCGSVVVSPSLRNILNVSTLGAGLEHILSAQTNFDSAFERGRLLHADDPACWLRWDGTNLTSGPTGSVSATVFGVIIPDPRVSDS